MMVGRQQIADLVVSHEELIDTQASRCPQLVQQQLMQEKFEPPHHLDHVAKTNQVPPSSCDHSSYSQPASS